MPVGWFTFARLNTARLERDQQRKLANRPDRGDRAKVKAARKARRRSL